MSTPHALELKKYKARASEGDSNEPVEISAKPSPYSYATLSLLTIIDRIVSLS
jgi:hypothetical protein